MGAEELKQKNRCQLDETREIKRLGRGKEDGEDMRKRLGPSIPQYDHWAKEVSANWATIASKLREGQSGRQLGFRWSGEGR
jgi:hypothetical protein